MDTTKGDMTIDVTRKLPRDYAEASIGRSYLLPNYLITVYEQNFLRGEAEPLIIPLQWCTREPIRRYSVKSGCIFYIDYVNLNQLPCAMRINRPDRNEAWDFGIVRKGVTNEIGYKSAQSVQ